MSEVAVFANRKARRQDVSLSTTIKQRSGAVSKAVNAVWEMAAFKDATVEKLEQLICKYDLTGLCRDLLALMHYAATVNSGDWWRYFEVELLYGRRESSPLRMLELVDVLQNSACRSQTGDLRACYDEKLGRFSVSLASAQVSSLSAKGVLPALCFYSFLLEYLPPRHLRVAIGADFRTLRGANEFDDAAKRFRRSVEQRLRRDLRSVHFTRIAGDIAAFLYIRAHERGFKNAIDTLIDNDAIFDYWVVNSRSTNKDFATRRFQTAARRVLFYRHAAQLARDASSILDVDATSDTDVMDYGVRKNPPFVIADLQTAERRYGFNLLKEESETKQLKLFLRTASRIDEMELGPSKPAEAQAEASDDNDGSGTCIFPKGRPEHGFERTCWRVWAYSYLEDNSRRANAEAEIQHGASFLPRIEGIRDAIRTRLLACAQILYSRRSHDLWRILPYVLSPATLARLTHDFAENDAGNDNSGHLGRPLDDVADLGRKASRLASYLSSPEGQLLLEKDVAEWKRAAAGVNLRGLKKSDYQNAADICPYLDVGLLFGRAHSLLVELVGRVSAAWFNGIPYNEDLARFRDVRSMVNVQLAAHSASPDNCPAGAARVFLEFDGWSVAVDKRLGIGTDPEFSILAEKLSGISGLGARHAVLMSYGESVYFQQLCTSCTSTVDGRSVKAPSVCFVHNGSVVILGPGVAATVRVEARLL